MHEDPIDLNSDLSHTGAMEHLGASQLEGPSDMTYGPDGEPIPGMEPTIGTIGNPEGESQDWQFQGTQNGMCGPTSIAMVVNEMGLAPGGHEISGAEVAEWAIAHGDMTPDGQPNSETDLGYEMSGEQISEVLAHYGVANEDITGGNVETLEGLLASGHQIILGVDGDRIWHDIPASEDAGQANHALVLTGIDPETGWAYLNDPGSPDGREEAVPIEVLMSAWSTSDYSAIVTDGTVQEAPIPNEEVTTEPSGGYAILPLVLDHELIQLREEVESSAAEVAENPIVQEIEQELGTEGAS